MDLYSYPASNKTTKSETFIYNFLTIVKSMDFPQEIELWYIIPAIRKELSKELKLLGLKQKDIANLLGITEAAVSQYQSSKRATNLKLNKELQKTIKKAAKQLINNTDSLLETVQELCETIRKQGILCKVHKKHSKNIPKKCKICMK